MNINYNRNVDELYAGILAKCVVSKKNATLRGVTWKYGETVAKR